jgi:integrase
VDIEKRYTKTGKPVWRVRWRHGGRRESRTFDRLSDAQNFAADIRLRGQRGLLDKLDSGQVTLDEYVSATWIPIYGPDLAPSTRRTYSGLYGHHIGPHLGHCALRELNPQLIKRWQAERIRDGAGPTAVRKALVLLGSILQTAVGEEIAVNPVRAVRKRRQPQSEEVRPLAPATVEAMRSAAISPAPTDVAASKRGHRSRRAYTLDPPGTPYTRHRDATIISVLAYAGLRPGEALALQWGDIRERTIHIQRAAALGEIKGTKNHVTRTVRLLAPLAADLREFKMASGRPSRTTLVFPSVDRAAWSKTTWDNWRERTFSRILAEAGRDHARPYDLRHSFASLLLHEGRSVIYVARQLGHGARLTLETYGHVIEELEDSPQLSAVEAIQEARAAAVAAPSDRPRQNVSLG